GHAPARDDEATAARAVCPVPSSLRPAPSSARPTARSASVVDAVPVNGSVRRGTAAAAGATAAGAAAGARVTCRPRTWVVACVVVVTAAGVAVVGLAVVAVVDVVVATAADSQPFLGLPLAAAFSH